MEEVILELTKSQLAKDKVAKALLGTIAGLVTGALVDMSYDKIVTARRLKVLTQK